MTNIGNQTHAGGFTVPLGATRNQTIHVLGEASRPTHRFFPKILGGGQVSIINSIELLRVLSRCHFVDESKNNLAAY